MCNCDREHSWYYAWCWEPFCTGKGNQALTTKECLCSLFLWIPFLGVLSWVICTYYYLSEGEKHTFVDVSRFFFEVVGILTIGFLTLFLIPLCNKMD